MSGTRAPQFWVLAGPNGAGKSTLADLYGLTARLPVISPDTIAATGKVNPLASGRQALAERERLLGRKADFAVDTTLSGRRELALMRRAAGCGYKSLSSRNGVWHTGGYEREQNELSQRLKR